MKNVLTIVLMLIGLNSEAQFSTMFNDTLLPFGSGAYHNRTICADDSFYYVGGVFYNGIIPVNQLYLLKLNTNGDVIKKKSTYDIRYNYNNYPYNSMLVSGNKIITCLQLSDSNYVVNGAVIAIDKHTLDTLWTKIYPHPDTANILSSADKFSDLTAIKATPDNCYILCGNYMSAGNERSYLMKIDSVGNTLWTKKYLTYSGFTNLIVSQDSGFFIPCNNNNSLKLIKFDKQGVFEWETSFNSNSNPCYPLSLSLISGNYLIIASAYWYDLNNELRGVTITKINTYSKSISWEKNFILYSNLRCITLFQSIGVEALPDGNIIVSGTLAKTGADLKGFIFKLNSNGDSLWTKTYSFGSPIYDDCQLNDLIVCDDGGFMGVGFFWSHLANVNDAAWIFKTDPNGVVGWEESKPLAGLVEAKVYPNPARDFVIIELPENRNQIASPKALNAELKLYNALGQLVLERQIAKGIKEIRIDLKEHKQGIYFFEIVNEEVVVGNGKFVRE